MPGLVLCPPGGAFPHVRILPYKSPTRADAPLDAQHHQAHPHVAEAIDNGRAVRLSWRCCLGGAISAALAGRNDLLRARSLKVPRIRQDID